MSRLPCEQVRITQAPEGLPRYTTLPAKCANPFCDRTAHSEHHVIRRSFTTSWKDQDYARIDGIIVKVKVPLCGSGTTGCHGDIEAGRATITWDADALMWVWNQGDNHDLILSVTPWIAQPGIETLSGGPIGHRESAGDEDDREVASGPSESACPHPALAEGEKCSCGYRKPHAKKQESPRSVPFSWRIPADLAPAFREVELAVFEHMRLLDDKGRTPPFARDKAIQVGYALILQTPAEELP